MIKLKRNTSIYKLANFNGELRDNTDICIVIRKALLGFFFAVILVIFVSFISVLILAIPFHITMFYITGVFISTPTLVITLIFLMIMLFFYLLFLGEKLITKASKTSVVKAAYEGYKEKYCPLVKVED